MGLRMVIGRLAAQRPHVLLVAVPGTTPVRLAAETWCRDHGAVLVSVPADADLLVITDQPKGDLAAAVDGLWRQLPGPRVRVNLESVALVSERLTAAQDRLAMGDALEGPALRGDEWLAGEPGSDDDGHSMDHMDAEMGDMHHDGGMDHDMGDMEMPAGLMMADRAEDRDGLKLDVLPVALGPVLPCWPTGLIVDVKLQGDVVQQATVRSWPEPVPGPAFWPGHPVAARLDRAADLLRLLGWDAAARRAIWLRDEALDDGSTDAVAQGVTRLRRRVSRSMLMRRSLRGLAAVGGSDASDRLLDWLSAGYDGLPFVPAVEETCQLMVGLDLAAARLVLASLPPDLDVAEATVAAHPGEGR